MAQPMIAIAHADEPWAQPAFYGAFQCIGAACEDTCCEGWGVSVDKATYEKYQNCSGSELSPKLEQLVTIKTVGSNSTYASIQLTGARCPFLADGLCDIQKELGEGYLSHTCATYPRMLNTFGHHRERSLDLSCPEAARLALLDVRPMTFCETGDLDRPDMAVRKLVLRLLQNRIYPVSKRLMLVGHVCDKWSELESAAASEEARKQFLEGFALAVDSKLYDAHLQRCTANPATQLATVLELMTARVRLDYTSPRYLALYGEFVDGLQLTSEGTWDEFGSRYAAAYRRYYAPFMERHEYMLENYLVAYAFKTMFPFGSAAVNRALNLKKPADTFVTQYMLMASYFSVSKAVMIGLAGQYKSGFAAEHGVRAIQSISRTLEHCESYPNRVLEILASKGIRNSAGMAILTQN
jgi:lysine-N-methylase